VDTRAISRSNDPDAGRLTAKKIFSGMTSIICLQGGAFIAADESLAGSCEPEAASVRDASVSAVPGDDRWGCSTML
jgi:hypothetical protein